MKLSFLRLLGLAAGSFAAAAAASAPSSAAADDDASASSASPLATTVTISIPASHVLSNPGVLPASTRATLSALGAPPSLSAPLTAANSFVFAGVGPGSYLLDVHCATHAFAPLRVDVALAPVGAGAAKPKSKGKGKGKLSVAAWETFRGNDWGNKGEAAARAEGGGFEVRCLGRKEYYMERSTFSVFSILKNPMILLALVSMGIFVGMPYLVENMDPEIRAEFEARQKSNPMNAMLGGGGGGSQPGGNFDMAAFLAGSNTGKKDEAAPSAAASSQSSGGGNGGGKKNQRR